MLTVTEVRSHEPSLVPPGPERWVRRNATPGFSGMLPFTIRVVSIVNIGTAASSRLFAFPRI